jgi:DNA repair protein RadC
VFDLMSPRLVDVLHEEFHSLLLNTQHRVLRDVLVTWGILDASPSHPYEVFRPAILERAGAVILVHNHPSGDPTPSPEDRVVRQQIAEAGRSIGSMVLDHVVVADEDWQAQCRTDCEGQQEPTCPWGVPAWKPPPCRTLRLKKPS